MVAGLVGATLASAGTSLQAIFRNPLADPQLIGISGGAMCGAGLVIVFGSPAILLGLDEGFGLAPVAIAAFAGALAATSFVQSIARVQSRPSMTHMLLAGIVINAASMTMIGHSTV